MVQMPTNAIIPPTSDSSRASPAIGILIATYNREDALRECLRHLEAQTWKDFEVVIVVDGSSDGTVQALERYEADAPLPLRYLLQPNGGVARARNAGVKLITAPLCLLLGDDVFPDPELVERHVAFHRQHPQENAVALGLTRWAEQGQVVTPFMRWLEDDGVQFAYGELMRGETPGWKHFYTSNLSLKTRYLAANPFSEVFPGAGMEDIELGYRLARRQGLAMYFLRDAVGRHLHPTTFAQSCLRVRHNGAMAAKFGELWPEQLWQPPRSAMKRLALRILTGRAFILPLLTRMAEAVTRVRCPNPLLKLVMGLHLRLGYEQACRPAAAGRDRTGVLK